MSFTKSATTQCDTKRRYRLVLFSSLWLYVLTHDVFVWGVCVDTCNFDLAIGYETNNLKDD